MFYERLKKRNLRVLLFTAVLGFFLFSPQVHTAHALSLTPVRFELEADPGETVTGQMLLMNESEVTETFYPSFANFEAQGETGNPAFVEPKEGLGTWITTEESVVLGPGKSEHVPFSITVPQNADAGGHFAVVFWGNNPNKEEGNVSVGTKAGVLMLLSVKGEVKEAGGLTEFKTTDNQFFYNTLPVSMYFKFKNDGNDRIKPEGKLTIRNTFFLPADRLSGNPVDGNVLPNSTRKFEINWVKHERSGEYEKPNGLVAQFFDQALYQWKNFAVGLYSANLSLTYGTQGLSAKDSVFFFVFPWQMLLVLFLIFLIVWFGGRKLLARYNRYIIEKAASGLGSSGKRSHGK